MKTILISKILLQLKTVVAIFLCLTGLTGVVYPLVVTGIAQVIFPVESQGSLIIADGQTVGSALIGQQFASEEYFWGRPSATAGDPYTAFDPMNLTGSSGSNLGPLSQILVDEVKARAQGLREANQTVTADIPIDLLTASASGLDPHISPQAALFQVSRVAKARGMDESVLQKLVFDYTEPPQFGILGEPRVNVLLLNMALDGIK
ncbi:MAG: potassium-transporting ATPase subunit KdpC [Chloroflexota bacterium]